MPIHGWELQIYLKSSQVVVYETEEYPFIYHGEKEKIYFKYLLVN